MKAQELRIGNYIEEDVLGRCKVSSLFKNGVVELECNHLNSEGEISFVWYTVNIESVNPILLTEDWLAMFGFEKKTNDDNFDYWCLGEFDDEFLWEHSEGFCYNFGFGHELKYVHTLQNLFYALTNEELTLKEE